MSQATISQRPYINSNLFSSHYLDERLKHRDEWDCNKEARKVMHELQDLYQHEQSLVKGYNEDALVDNWIDEVLEVLGFGTQPEVTLPEGGGYIDELLFETPETRRNAAEVYLDTEDTTDLYERGVGIVEAKQWNADFTARFSDQRPYRNASHQIKHYLEKTTSGIQWGILTNGRKWRLYGTYEYETQTYYEVDLPELLENDNLEAFKYFYLFFRPDAYYEFGGSTFHDEVFSESETASQELGESLQDNVFTALRVLGRGFIETNSSLDIDPNDDEALDELKQQSLVFLYRLMFVLYAESRGLIQAENQSAQNEYDQNFSLDELRLEIHDRVGEVDNGFENEFSNYSTTMWNRMEDLFRLIDDGKEKLGIPPYNGGLFNHEEHEFLTRYEVSNQYLAEVIYRLTTTQNNEGRFVLADYSDLDTRHLGSVYEGLLEHQFRIAPEQYAAVSEDGGQAWKPADEISVAGAVETVPEGGLYVVNDEGERKATGAYYTPDYVVTYMIEETIQPLIEQIRNDLIQQGFQPGTQEYIGPFLNRITNLRILDPAMGSGHFLTKATGYLSEQVMAEIREAESDMGASFDEQYVRREIAKECIYGVDLNRMAVELAKLSMWLETLAADRPLAFLDHHLKAGNSLIGSDIAEVLSDNADNSSGQLTLTQSFSRARQQTLEYVMDLMQELLNIDNRTISDISSMKEIYGNIQSDPLYQRLFEITNVHTAEKFGLDVPNDVYEKMAESIENSNDWKKVQKQDWFQSAQKMAHDRSYFHWELEFPEIFFDLSGKKLEAAGFDAVIGNPPYVRIYGDTLADAYVDYLRGKYTTAYMKFDLYVVFSEMGIELTRNNGTFSYIIPDKFISTPYGEPLRNKILEDTTIASILDLREREVFADASVSNVIPVLYKQSNNTDTVEIRSLTENNETKANKISQDAIVSDEDHSFRLSRTVEDMQLTSKIREKSIRFDSIFYTNWGLRTGTAKKTKKYIVETDTDPNSHAMVRGEDIVEGYRLQEPSEYIIYEKEDLYNAMFEELFESNKIIFRKISGSGLMAVADKNEYYCFSTLIPCVNIQKIKHVDRTGIPEGTPESKAYDDIYYALAIVNSSLLEWFYQVNLSDDLSVVPGHINEIPIAEITNIDAEVDTERLNALIDKSQVAVQDNISVDSVISVIGDELDNNNDRLIHDILSNLAQMNSNFHSTHESLNLRLPDYLGSYDEDLIISNVGFVQPQTGSADSILRQTTKQKPYLRVGKAVINRTSRDTVEVFLTAEYKPDPDKMGKDSYTETDPIPALRIIDLQEPEADLIEAFVPVAVEKAEGFAGFYDYATKTNSLLDRLKDIVLPNLDDVADGIEEYKKTTERAEELDRKIKQIERLIDEIVYELYGLTDEEIEIVEDVVSKD